jgi:transcriptional regulator with XRE-family HTH domain
MYLERSIACGRRRKDASGVNLTDEQKVELGRRLAAAREAAGLRKSDAAKAIDAQWHTIQRYENGEFAPSSARIVALAELYGVTPTELMPSAATEESHVEREDDAYSAFLDFLETPIALQLKAGQVLGQPTDASILDDIRGTRFTGVEPTVHLYTTMAYLEIARRRGKLPPEGAPVEVQVRSNVRRLPPKKKG